MTYSLENIYSFTRTSYVFFDSLQGPRSKLIDIDNDGKLNILASIAKGDLYSDTSWACLSDFEATGWVGIQPISNNIPEDYKLLQNYPNPFNNETVIKFDLKTNSNIKLKVYDISGREITEIVNEYKPAGSYKIKFDAGKYNLSSGVYFYVLKTEKFTDVKKMIYVK